MEPDRDEIIIQLLLDIIEAQKVTNAKLDAMSVKLDKLSSSAYEAEKRLEKAEKRQRMH